MTEKVKSEAVLASDFVFTLKPAFEDDSKAGFVLLFAAGKCSRQMLSCEYNCGCAFAREGEDAVGVQGAQVFIHHIFGVALGEDGLHDA